MDTQDTVFRLRKLQAMRRSLIQQNTAITNRLRRYIAGQFGFDVTLADAKRKEIATRQKRVYKALLAKIIRMDKGEEVATKKERLEDERERAIVDDECVLEYVGTVYLAMRPAEKLRLSVENKIGELASHLPIADFAERVRGLSLTQIGVIIGEAGDLSDYDNPSKLWKRFGLAPTQCYKMVTESGAEVIAKPSRRRSEMWVIGDCLVKQNGSDGEYRPLYDMRKALERQKNIDGTNRESAIAARKRKGGTNAWTSGSVTPESAAKFYAAYDATDKKKRSGMKPETVEAGLGLPMIAPGHINRRAQAYMEKRLLLDMWVAWNRETCGGGHGRVVAQAESASPAQNKARLANVSLQPIKWVPAAPDFQPETGECLAVAAVDDTSTSRLD